MNVDGFSKIKGVLISKNNQSVPMIFYSRNCDSYFTFFIVCLFLKCLYE